MNISAVFVHVDRVIIIKQASKLSLRTNAWWIT